MWIIQRVIERKRERERKIEIGAKLIYLEQSLPRQSKDINDIV